MKAYRVYFDRCSGTQDYAYFPAENLTEAKRRAQEYRRAWNIEEKVTKVVEVPQIITFGRYDSVSVWMRWKDEDLYTRSFDKDATVGEIYDAIQECIGIQDGIAEGSE